MTWNLRAIEAMGSGRRITRKVLWRGEYERSSLAWYAMIDPDLVRRTYTGKERFYSYLTARYRDLVMVA